MFHPIIVAALIVAGAWSARAADVQFRVQEIEARLGVGYAVQVVDLNADKKPDIVVVDQERVVWYENPTWKRHALIEKQTKRDNVCLAAHDIDGDGLVDFALGAEWAPSNTRSGGTIQWLRRGKTPGDSWSVHAIGEEPTVHRMRWIDLDGDGCQELVVVPLMGRNSTPPDYKQNGVRILAYKIPKDPTGDWKPEVLNDELHVAHNFVETDLDRDGKTDLLVASFEGVSLLTKGESGKWSRWHIGEGNQKTSPNRGASEIKHGRLLDSHGYIATIEPWHGHQVVVYTRPDGKLPAALYKKWNRHVLDEELKWGHAVWCANLDNDADEELIIGVRDDKDATARCGVRIYDPAPAGDPTSWKRQLLDPGGVAVEDLTAADLNADGRVDLIAAGRATRNVRIYWNQAK